MTKPQARRSFLRTVLVASMIAALVSCSGSGDSSSDTRQRNSALECLPGDPNESTTTVENDPCSSTTTTAYDEASQSVTCDVLWDAEAKTLTACGDAYGMGVAVTDDAGNEQGSFKNDTRSVKVATFDGTSKVRVVVYLTADEYSAGTDSHSLEFEAAVSATKSFTYTPAPVDPLKDETDLLRFSTIVDSTSPWVGQTIKLDTPLVSADEVTATVSARLNSQDTTAGELTVSMILGRGAENVLQKDASMSDTTTFETLTISLKNEETDITGVDTITLNINGHSGRQWSGNYGPDVTFAGVTVNGEQKLNNTGFSDGTTAWTSTSGFQQCSGDNGEKPCVTSAVAVDTPETTTTTVEETPITVEETTTTVEETPENGEETTTTAQSTASRLAATISVQEVPCAVGFNVADGTISLCESFDRIVGAAFDADGKFSETIEAKGSSFVLPTGLVAAGKARFVRIAVGQKQNGLQVATFRGEGLLDLGEGTQDVSGTIYVSPAGKEAINSGGVPDYFSVELRNDGKFDIYDIDDNEFAFVTLNGEVFAEYDRVSPPSSWDEGKPLAWRAYQADGFGLPRLVASGVLALGGREEVDYTNPSFELNSQRVELITGEAQGGGPDEPETGGDPCGAVNPYMITTPITPSRTNMVTFTVTTDCESTESMLGIVVYDYDDDWVPVFSQFKSTRFTSRIVATTFLADGEYDVQWGDFDLVGTHEYVVNGGGTGANCFHPQLDVDTDALKATLSNCNPGAHRMRIYADSLFRSQEGDDFRLPFKDNVIDLSMVTWEGFFEINLKIDDAMEPDFITCLKSCETAPNNDPGIETSVDTSNFASDASVSVSSNCVVPPAPEGEGWTEDWRWRDTYIYRPAGNGAYTFENWVPYIGDDFTGTATASMHLPTNGKFMVITWCGGEWRTEDYEWTNTELASLNSFEVSAPMPNRPSNDRLMEAPAIEAGVGQVQFSNVSATNEQGEMGIEYSTSDDAGQFHSVWFTYTPKETGTANFRLTDYDFDALMRVTAQDADGRTILLDEAEMWTEDVFWCGCDTEQWETVNFTAKAGTTYYIQITNEDYENSVGTATLLVNGGEGDTVQVQPGDQPFLSPTQLMNPFPSTTTTTTPSTSTTLAPVDTVAPGTPTSVPQSSAGQAYENAKNQGATNDVVTVLAPVKDGPATIETRQDVRTVQIPVADLYGTVSAASANVNTARSLTLHQNGRRPMKVKASDKFVTLPVGTSTEELMVVATDTSGKTVAAPITIKKTVTPLVKVNGSSSDGSGVPVLPIGIAVAVLLAGAAFVQVRRRSAVAAPSDNDGTQH